MSAKRSNELLKGLYTSLMSGDNSSDTEEYEFCEDEDGGKQSTGGKHALHWHR